MNLNPEFSIGNFEVGEYRIEIDEDGTVEIETDCCCGTWTTTTLTIDQLQEIVDAARKFCEQRGTRRENANLDEARRQLCENRAAKWSLEKEVERLQSALQWIADHDQTRRPNGGDPQWFSDNAPIRARKALYGEQ